MNQLRRVQVYLNPDSLTAIDAIASTINIKRSQIIRDLTDILAIKYVKTSLMLKKTSKPNIKLWEDLSGIGKSETGTLGLNVDEIYEFD